MQAAVRIVSRNTLSVLEWENLCCLHYKLLHISPRFHYDIDIRGQPRKQEKAGALLALCIAFSVIRKL